MLCFFLVRPLSGGERLVNGALYFVGALGAQ
jgi:hypothetical protein